MMQASTRLFATRLFALAVVLAVPLAANATVLWRGDLETGNIAQWSKTQAQAAQRLQVTNAPLRQGHYALRTELRHGDLNSNGNRAELVRMVAEVSGNERYYSWSTFFTSDFPTLSGAWQVFTQWHHSGSTGSPPLELSLNGTTMQLFSSSKGTGVRLWAAPLVRNRWHDFVMHVKWSSSSSVGFVELWYDGVKVLNKTMWPTMYSGQVNYLKQGLYRKTTITPTALIYHDGMTIGTTLADVSPSLARAQALQSGIALTEELPSDSQAAADGTMIASNGTIEGSDATMVAEHLWDESERNDVALDDSALEMAALESGGGCSSTGGTAAMSGFVMALAALVALRRRRTATPLLQAR